MTVLPNNFKESKENAIMDTYESDKLYIINLVRNTRLKPKDALKWEEMIHLLEEINGRERTIL